MLFVARGVVIGMSIIAPHIVVAVLGWTFVARGVLGFISLFGYSSGFWWAMPPAIISITAGLALIGWPTSEPKSVGLLLVSYFMVEGSSNIAQALAHRHHEFADRPWMLAGGILEIGMAVAMLAGVPGATIVGFTAMASITIVLSGLSIVAGVFRAHRRLGEWLNSLKHKSFFQQT